MALGG
jgi:tetratricopeptide (TPR) repeat protein